MFSQANLYSRLRSNTFNYNWEEESASQKNHLISALGASFIFESATFSDFDMTAGLYFSHGFYKGDITTFKPGKDAISRLDETNTGNRSLAVLGEAYLRYSGIKNHKLKIGRQIVTTFYTKSNDTKMVPNTFDAFVVKNNSIKDTTVKIAYLAQQKLRDHAQSHAVLAYGDSTSSNLLNPQYSENDDSAMHKGLTVAKLVASGRDPDAPLLVADMKYKASKNLKIDFSSYVVPDMVSQIMTEVNYKMPSENSLSTSTGVRYIKQFDNGAGAIGGAALEGNAATSNYTKPNSLESQMIAARLVTKYQNYKLNIAMTYILDEADLVTPWRGFPTAGYTRSMARYNWEANTKSYRIALQMNNDKKAHYHDTFIETSILYTDADENKGEFDETYYYLGFLHTLKSVASLTWKLRLGYADTQKTLTDSLDSRFELNYLF